MKGKDFGEQGDEIEITGGRPAIPPEKLEAYRKGNPMNTIVVPQIEMATETDLLEIELPDVKENEKPTQESGNVNTETKDTKNVNGNGEKDKTEADGKLDDDMSFLDDL